MSMMCLLSRCALCQVIGESSEGVLRFFGDRYSDRNRQLANALHGSAEKAWKALEVSLAGETLWNKLDAADEKAFRQQVRNLLDNMTLPMLTNRDDYRKLCLEELRAARRAGHLLGKTTPEELRLSLGAFAADPNPDAAIAQQRAAVQEMAHYLERQQYTRLAWLVAHEVQPGQGLLVVAVQYFFRRAIESSDGLRDSLQLSRIEGLTQSQAASFQLLEQLLQTHGQQMEKSLDGLLGVALETHDAVLDVREEQQKHGGQLSEIYSMLHQIMELARMHQRREVRPGDTRSIRGTRERQRVRELTVRYEALPDREKQQRPALLNSVALLQLAAGDMHAAQSNFDRVADLVAHDPRAKAQAHFNAYHAALDRHDYPGAIEALRESVALDPERYSPFPFSDYEPEKVLGAGGFGVAFKCRHMALKRPIVVKSIWLDGLERDVDDVFREAQVLNDLDHPGIIHLRDCRFADAERRRPFLVMDYFESLNLAEHVRQFGVLSAADLLPVARAAAEALHSAHAQGILHRDIKPENLLVRREANGAWRVKLIDFGLAVKQETVEMAARTMDTPSPTPREFGIAGTVDYAAPEQMGRLPGVPVGPYSDVYSFARTCYFALLGTPEPDDAERETLPEGWRKLLSQCTARKIEGRIKDFAAVLERLHALESGAAPPTPSPQTPQEIPTLKPAPLPPTRKGGVPPRYIDSPAPAASPAKLVLSPLWSGTGSQSAHSSSQTQSQTASLCEPELTGATPAGDEKPPEAAAPSEEPIPTTKKRRRGPLGDAFSPS